MRKIILYSILLLPILNFSQALKNGIIITEIDSLKYSDKNCCILSPEKGFTAYNEPNGKIIGKIKRLESKEKNDQLAYEIYLVTENKNLKLNEYTQIGYEIFALNFIKEEDGFIKLKNQSRNIWLNINELNKLGFKAINWIDYMVLNSEKVLGYYAKEPGLRLRNKPDLLGEIIGSVRGDLFEIKLTGAILGNWAKVKITKYREHPCFTESNENENIEFKSEGWLKIIDDNGEPNLWNYTRGC